VINRNLHYISHCFKYRGLLIIGQIFADDGGASL